MLEDNFFIYLFTYIEILEGGLIMFPGFPPSKSNCLTVLHLITSFYYSSSTLF